MSKVRVLLTFEVTDEEKAVAAALADAQTRYPTDHTAHTVFDGAGAALNLVDALLIEHSLDAKGLELVEISEA